MIINGGCVFVFMCIPLCMYVCVHAHVCVSGVLYCVRDINKTEWVGVSRLLSTVQYVIELSSHPASQGMTDISVLHSVA